ncbi:MAG: ESPR domain-containing protein, partial [Comamonas sp.]
MNRIYRTIWNATLCAWVAAPETARTGGGCASAGAVVGGSAPASRLLLRWHSIAGAIAKAWGVLVATPAQAICSGST